MLLNMLGGGKVEVEVQEAQTVQSSGAGQDVIFELAQVAAWSDPTVVGNFVAYGRTGSDICIWLAGGDKASATAAYRQRVRRYKTFAVC